MATPTEFAQQMKVTIPRKIADKAQRVYLDSILQADAMLAKDVKHGGRTPVDTGYMRATRTGSTLGVPPVDPPERAKNLAQKKAWAGSTGGAGVMVAAKSAVQHYLPMTIGFVAVYAKYMEDQYGMVKGVVMAWPRIVRTAISNAQGGAQ